MGGGVVVLFPVRFPVRLRQRAVGVLPRRRDVSAVDMIPVLAPQPLRVVREVALTLALYRRHHVVLGDALILGLSHPLSVVRAVDSIPAHHLLEYLEVITTSSCKIQAHHYL